ncbi:hypothetical protein NHX12_021212 [Muraenolepis orangiensis]|uniref:Uncharacterized protein n=1 Tax=Muraenolepis orangiensis TaxID=630683 RepID=A0A9Q0ETA9_9TELE|nr:hypothetical protein NHX12_021212 [Muraenolepis orangiensis]
MTMSVPERNSGSEGKEEESEDESEILEESPCGRWQKRKEQITPHPHDDDGGTPVEKDRRPGVVPLLSPGDQRRSSATFCLSLVESNVGKPLVVTYIQH